MAKSWDQGTAPMSRPRRFKLGIRGWLIVVSLAALGLGRLAHEQRGADRRTALIRELARFHTHSRLNEPTIVGQVVKKFWPSREDWLRGQIGAGWFDHPSIFVGFNLRDDRVPQVVPRLRELGTVEEVHYDGDHLTEAGIAQLRAGLPGVNVVPNAATDQHRFFLAARGEHLAYGALGFTIVVALILLTLLVLFIRWLTGHWRTARLALDLAEPRRIDSAVEGPSSGY